MTAMPPVVLFVYARPQHTQRTLSALVANARARQVDLIVFSDGARTQADGPLVGQVRALIGRQAGFKSVRLVERDANMGLARNIVAGLDEVFREHRAAIVLEDDIECAPEFLDFMSRALACFENDRRVWHVNGWNYPIPTDGLPGAYCAATMNCWGWATWADRWAQLNLDAASFMRRWSVARRYRFNLDGSYPFYSHLLSNYLGTRRTWAVFWYATIFEAQGLCVQPARSMTREIGSDGSGTHRLDSDMYVSDMIGGPLPSFSEFPIQEHREARARTVAFNRRHFGVMSRLFNGIRLLLPWRVYAVRKALGHVRATQR